MAIQVQPQTVGNVPKTNVAMNLPDQADLFQPSRVHARPIFDGQESHKLDYRYMSVGPTIMSLNKVHITLTPFTVISDLIIRYIFLLGTTHFEDLNC